MSAISYAIGILAPILVIVVVIQMLRHNRLRERHAVGWLAAGLLALVIGVFPPLLDWMADLAGVEVPTNLGFFVSIAVLFLVCLQNSAELTETESKIRVLAEHSAMQDDRIRRLEEKRTR